MIDKLVRWWRRPPLRDRVLAALLPSGSVGLQGLVIRERLDLFGSPYALLSRLVDDGLVERLDAPDLAIGFGARTIQRFRYRLTEQGRHAALSPAPSARAREEDR